MTAQLSPHASPRNADPAPPLENGDHLARAEFEHRYQAMPNLKKAELIEGVVYMPSPVRLDRHGNPHCRLAGWIALYEMSTPGVFSGDNATVCLDDDNMPQPDLLLMIAPDRGGQAGVNAQGYVEAAPELVAEVASSSASYDLHVKARMYARHGAREYLVWRVLDGEIDWFVARDGALARMAPGPDGVSRGEAFPGLWLDAAALLRGDGARLLEVARQGLASAEHAAFVARLAAPTA